MRLTRLASAFIVISFVLYACGSGAERQQNRPETQQPAAQPARQAEKKPPRAIDPNRFALVVAGVGGEEAYTRKFTAQATRLYETLTTQLGFGPKNVFLLTETTASGPEDGARESEVAPAKRATAEEVRNSFAAIKAAANPESFVLVILIGHGSFDNQVGKFNLVGPDLSAKDYAQLVGTLPNKRVVFVNCASSSGEFIKPLSAEGRVVITATRSGSEQNATIHHAPEFYE